LKHDKRDKTPTLRARFSRDFFHILSVIVPKTWVVAIKNSKQLSTKLRKNTFGAMIVPVHAKHCIFISSSWKRKHRIGCFYCKPVRSTQGLNMLVHSTQAQNEATRSTQGVGEFHRQK